MVDDLTQESFQTGKAVVTVSVDIINAIADACRESERVGKLEFKNSHYGLKFRHNTRN